MRKTSGYAEVGGLSTVLPDTTHLQLTQRPELVVPIVERFLSQGR